jgi:hypothetical protein
MKKGWILAGLAVACGMGAQAADFINLDFEDYAGTGNELLPGWERSANTYLWPLFDGLPLASAGLGLGSSNTTAWSGKYSAFFSTGQYSVWDETYGYISICCGAPEIWQTATVPSAATHVRYVASPSTIKNESELRMQGWLGGSDLSAGTPEAMPNGSLRYATDIQSLAGQEAMLKFGCAGSDDPFNPGTHHWLDQIEFLDAEGTVIWPPPCPEPVVCLEDFHAATLNSSLWEVVAAFGTANDYSISSESLRTTVNPLSAPFETIYRYRSVFRGDWDVRMDFNLMVLATATTNPGVLGMALAADFGPERTSVAGVGHLITISNQTRFFAMDWGQGPTHEMATTNPAGVFRLARTGEEVAGYVWDAGGNDWIDRGDGGWLHGRGGPRRVEGVVHRDVGREKRLCLCRQPGDGQRADKFGRAGGQDVRAGRKRGADGRVGVGGDSAEQPVCGDLRDEPGRFGLGADVGGDRGFRRRNELDGRKSGHGPVLLPHRIRPGPVGRCVSTVVEISRAANRALARAGKTPIAGEVEKAGMAGRSAYRSGA